ncbi:MAG TPA: ABC transporter ATP-binding protein [Paenibacillus sp.]|uniref:metal ABC transporter ATP-binding protein n=1 Tax=Paenibacillus sp. TaxID=58172 RepID=UPI0028D03FA9|nr:ABC transporter ATP-binding protein [Paenibacillus sp.]HUC93760.1 ABC transporter ATP-binding protein [Paenibacillus sp.]
MAHTEEFDIRLDQVAVSLGGARIHQNLTFSIRHGEFLGVIGPNGAGKTTLFRLLLGLIQPDRGSVHLGGRQIKGKGSSSIGYVPQSRLIDPETPLRAWDFVSLGLEGKFVPWLTKAERKRVGEAIHLVEADAYMDKPIGLLSGGERQRLYLAQALLANPKCLLLDEPTSNLDPGSQERIVELVDDIRRQLGVTVVFISHDINLINRFADRILYLTKGDYAIDVPERLLTEEVLSRLYHMPTEVIRLKDKVFISTASSRENSSICTH